MSEDNNMFDRNDGPQYTQAPETSSYGGTNNYEPMKGQSNGFGIASMVCGILALITCCMWCTVIPLGIVSIVLGILQIVKNESKGMAIAGIVCASVGLILFIGLTIYGNYLQSIGAYNELYRMLEEYGYSY